jgi:DNA segregation ATPase FtsK/SpoIIIE, S-DNA-T family
VLQTRRPSISLVQRHLRIGYNRAARLIEQMERAGLVTPMQSNGNRDVLASAPKGEGR